MSGEPPFSLSDSPDEAGIDPENIDPDETERINEVLAELNPEPYGTGGGDGGGDTGPPTLDGSLQEFGASISASGNTAIVGAPGTNSGAGEVYIYTNASGSWSSSADFALTNADSETVG